MTDWTTLPNQSVGVGGLPSGTTVTALRDNPVAIAEGSPGAPRVKARAITPEFLPLVSGTGTSANGWTNLDPLTVVELFVAVRGGGFARDIQLRASADGGVNYGDWTNIASAEPGELFSFYSTVNLQDGSFESAVNSDSLGESGSLGVSNIDALQIRGSAAGTIAYSCKGRAITRVGG